MRWRSIRGCLHDGLRFASTLAPYKVSNAFVIYLSYLLSVLFRYPVVWGRPFSLSIEPTNHCNLNCPECPSGINDLNRQRGFMPIPLYKSIIDATESHLTWLMLYFQGEPFLHNELPEMIAYAKSKNVYTCVSTNGHFLSPQVCRDIIYSGTDRLIISMDGVDQMTYEKYRVKGNLERVQEGIRQLAEEKKKAKVHHPYIILQSLAFRHNQHQLDEIRNVGRSLGANRVVIKTAQLYDYAGKASVIPNNPLYSRYRKGEDGNLHLKNKLKNRCFRIWNSCVISHEGILLPCCYDKKGEHPLADLTRQSFQQGWKSKTFHVYRNNILTNRKQVDICRNCTES